MLNGVLLDLQERAAKAGRRWPKHLWLQLDNTAKENKNQFLINYCALLVNKGAFKSVRGSGV